MPDLSKRHFFSSKRNKAFISLPWLKSKENFLDQCTQCRRCIESCPQQIVVKGSGGFPEIDFNQGECDFCYQCAASCPEKLFESKEQQAWQQKVQISQQCLLENGTECRSCGDSCDTQAINFTLQIGRPAKASIDTHDCNGCGACISSCPSTAISVFFPQIDEERPHEVT